MRARVRERIASAADEPGGPFFRAFSVESPRTGFDFLVRRDIPHNVDLA